MRLQVSCVGVGLGVGAGVDEDVGVGVSVGGVGESSGALFLQRITDAHTM